MGATTLDHVAVRLRLIGSMAAWTVGGENVLPSGRKTRALLACVALATPRPVLRNRLMEQLWSRSPEQQARASLRQEIHRLRDALSLADANLLIVTRDHLALRPGAIWSDVQEVMQANSERPEALSLLDADLLEDLEGTDANFDAWLYAEREQLRERALKLAASMLQQDLSPDEAIEAAKRLLTIDLSHEAAWQTLIRAHDARGEHGLAIQAYHRCQAALSDMLDATPSAETQKLIHGIQNSSSSEMWPRLRQQKKFDASPKVNRPGLWEPAGPPFNSKPTMPRGIQVGVMPFRLIGLLDEHVSVARGLAEEITTALSQFRGLSIISSDSLGRFAANHRDEALIRRKFGLDFLLDGSVQRAGIRVRVSLQLLDLRANNHIVWARRFDHEINDPLSVQDEITAEVVAQIDPELLLIEARRSISNRPDDGNVYDLMLRAISLIGRIERKSFMQAEQHLAAAIALEPDYPPAHAWYAYWHIFLVGQGWADHPAAIMRKAGELAERAVVLDPRDARGLSINGHVQAFLHCRLHEAMALHERALSINPNLAMAWALSAMTHAYAGNPDEAERRLKRYKRLSPLHPHAIVFDGFAGVIHLMKRDYEGAVEVGRNISQLNPSFSAIYRPYLAALGHLRRDHEAATIRRRFLQLEPDFTIERFLKYSPIANDSDKMHYAEGLRLAGIPE